jgi:predicted DNA-binding ribbon-helix-helix protein
MLLKRSFTIAGHRTSIALEAEFWSVLEEAATRRRETLPAFIASIDAGRGERPLASALRLQALAAVRRPE